MNHYQRVDVSGLGNTYATTPTVTFGAESVSQDLLNFTGTEAIFVSFDGVNDHGRLGLAAEPDRGHTWLQHKIDRLWLRRSAGPGGGAQYVDVYAWS